MAHTLGSLETAETSLAMFKVLAENSFESIMITDTTTKVEVVYANKAFKKLTGYDSVDIIGPRVLQGVGTDKKVIDRLAVVLETGKIFEGKAINYKKDGTPFTMHWRVLPIKVGKKIDSWIAIQREGTTICYLKKLSGKELLHVSQVHHVRVARGLQPRLAPRA
ncbi:MAG: PAS domain S-box-containing protein [Candidatus Azotimanducaceae bacterium]|jgi:PAS domain S-box-containing protein